MSCKKLQFLVFSGKIQIVAERFWLCVFQFASPLAPRMCSSLPICKYLTDVPVWRRLGRQTHKAPSCFRSCEHGNRIHTRVSWSSSPYIWQPCHWVDFCPKGSWQTVDHCAGLHKFSSPQCWAGGCGRKCPQFHIILYGLYNTRYTSGKSIGGLARTLLELWICIMISYDFNDFIDFMYWYILRHFLSKCQSLLSITIGWSVLPWEFYCCASPSFDHLPTIAKAQVMRCWWLQVGSSTKGSYFHAELFKNKSKVTRSLFPMVFRGLKVTKSYSS